MTQIIRFKESPNLGQFLADLLPESIICIVYFMAAYSWSRWRKKIVITEIFREHDPVGTHKNWRAIDVRNSVFTRAEALELAGRVNTFAVYDPTRPEKKCCIVYELDPNGKHDDHFHIQVHERTVINADGF